MILEYTKNENDNYATLRQVLTREFNISNELRLNLKRANNIFVNNTPAYIDYPLSIGDTVTVCLDFDEESNNIIATKMNLNILYEDDAFLILDKPSGIPVHPSILHFNDSLSNGVKYYFDKINLKRKIRPVNRLDRNTSGIVIFAKNEYIHSMLSSQMQNHIFKKEYIAICNGIFNTKEDTISAPIARKTDSIIERCVSADGDSAITHYKVIYENLYSSFSELLISLETGRTHQIRVHTAYIGHPILGDSLYGKESNLINRQALHSYRVEFIHPITKQIINITAPIPSDMQRLLKK